MLGVSLQGRNPFSRVQVDAQELRLYQMRRSAFWPPSVGMHMICSLLPTSSYSSPSLSAQKHPLIHTLLVLLFILDIYMTWPCFTECNLACQCESQDPFIKEAIWMKAVDQVTIGPTVGIVRVLFGYYLQFL